MQGNENSSTRLGNPLATELRSHSELGMQKSGETFASVPVRFLTLDPQAPRSAFFMYNIRGEIIRLCVDTKAVYTKRYEAYRGILINTPQCRDMLRIRGDRDTRRFVMAVPVAQ